MRFPDGTVKTVQPGGAEESLFSDGTLQRIHVDRTREIQYPNGQREIHTPDFKVDIYSLSQNCRLRHSYNYE